jgi:hypothetical protein
MSQLLGSSWGSQQQQQTQQSEPSYSLMTSALIDNPMQMSYEFFHHYPTSAPSDSASGEAHDMAHRRFLSVKIDRAPSAAVLDPPCFVVARAPQ